MLATLGIAHRWISWAIPSPIMFSQSSYSCSTKAVVFWQVFEGHLYYHVALKVECIVPEALSKA